MASDQDKRRSEPVGEVVRIFTRGRLWWANFQLGGRQHRRSLKTTSKKEARRRALLLEAEVLEGRHKPSPKPAAVDAAIEGYLDYLRTERRSKKTMVKYIKVLDRLAGLLRDRRAASLLDLDRRAVDAYRGARVAAGAAPKTVYNETVIVRQLVNFAVGRGLIGSDPLRGLKIREPRPTPQPCWSPAEVEWILAASPESHREALTILADTGMRVGELQHLAWDDVDFERNLLHIRAKGDWRPKTGDQRAIPMSPRVATVFRRLPRHGRWVVTALPSPRYPRGDHQVSGRRLLLVLKRVLRGLGLPGHLHTFRHAFISRALTEGIPEAVVRDWVGHVDRDILRLYTHIASTISQSSMRRLAAAPAAAGSIEGGETGGGRGPRPVQIQHKSKEQESDPRAK